MEKKINFERSNKKKAKFIKEKGFNCNFENVIKIVN